MKAMLKYLAAIAITLPLLTSFGYSQAKVNRSILGTGGGIMEQVDGAKTLRGTFGQMAVAKKSTTTGAGQDATVYMGFWGPGQAGTDVETPVYVDNKNSMTNYPNPFTSSTTIKYTLPGEAKVTLRVYDISGAVVRTLVDEMQFAGDQSIDWDAKTNEGSELSSGSYLYELSVEPASFVGSNGFEAFTLRNVMVLSK